MLYFHIISTIRYKLNIIEKYGATVYMINEDVNEFSFIHKFISIYIKRLYAFVLHKYYLRQFKCLPNKIDYILIIKGSTIRKAEIDYLKNKYNNAEFIMYQWDSVAYYPYALEIANGVIGSLHLILMMPRSLVGHIGHYFLILLRVI